MIKVLHVDDDRHHYELTKAQLSRLSDDIVLELVDSSQSALVALKDDVYDCLITDDQLPENDGLELLKSLREGGNIIPIVVLSELEDEEKQNFLEKAYSEDEFNVAVDFFHFEILNYWIHRLVDKYRQFLKADKLEIDLFYSSPKKIEELQKAMKTLTKREAEILNLIGIGKSNKEIAEELIISYKTVKNHVYNLFAKLGIHTRAEAIHFAIRMKISNE
ncbi:response regulator transcription factor [Candidatus Pacearchaeota archaeon]|nr:response regulator transcription factor [Candidatus Pacearchaeota archaeon]